MSVSKPLFPVAALLFAGLIAPVVNYVHADLLWVNSGVTPNDAYFSDIDFSPQFVADDFFLESDSRLESIQWTGIYGNSIRPDDFSIEIMIDSDLSTTVYEMTTIYDIPITQRTRTNLGLTVLNRDLFSYTADVTAFNIDLNGGQQYYITIYNNTNDGRWNIAADNSSGRAIFDGDGRDSISTFNGSLDYRLFGFAVPEPGAGVFLISLGLLLSSRRRRVVLLRNHLPQTHVKV